MSSNDVAPNKTPKDFLETEDNEIVPAVRDEGGNLVPAMKDIQGVWIPSPGYIPTGKAKLEADIKKFVPTKEACNKFMAKFKGENKMADAYEADEVLFRCARFYKRGLKREEIYKILKKEAPTKYKEQQLEERWKKEDATERAQNKPQIAAPENLAAKMKVKNGFRSLVTTSQGTIFDLPPEDWIFAELVRFGARVRPNGKVRAPDLDGDLHPVFHRFHWPKIDQKRYDALHQSMLLATKMVSLSGALMAVFLPAFQASAKRDGIFTASREPFNDAIPISTALRGRMDQALDCFEKDLASLVTWREGENMLSAQGWFGINTPRNGPLDTPADRWDWENSWDEDQEEGLEARCVDIGIMSQFADILLLSEPSSERYLFATFYAAITMTHELCHFWYLHQCFDDEEGPADGEAFLGTDLRMELGDSYIGWLFGGFLPRVMTVKDQTRGGFGRFRNGICWEEALLFGIPDRYYETHYSMEIKHMERMLSQKEWDKHKDRIKSDPAGVRKDMLHPQLPFQIGKVARIARPGRLAATSSFGFDAKGVQRTLIDYTATPFRYLDRHWNDEADSAPPIDLTGSDNEMTPKTSKSLQKERATLTGKVDQFGVKINELSLKRSRDQNRVQEIDEKLEKRVKVDASSSMSLEDVAAASVAGYSSGNNPPQVVNIGKFPPKLQSIWRYMTDEQRKKHFRNLVELNKKTDSGELEQDEQTKKKIQKSPLKKVGIREEEGAGGGGDDEAEEEERSEKENSQVRKANWKDADEENAEGPRKKKRTEKTEKK